MDNKFKAQRSHEHVETLNSVEYAVNIDIECKTTYM